MLLKQARLVVAAIEHGVIGIACALFELVRRDADRHILRFVVGVAAGGDANLLARAVFRPQFLLEQLVVVPDQAVGGVEDARRGAVVLFELDDAQCRVIDLQLAQVLDVRAAPRVDGLVVVAHRRERAALADQRTQQAVLRAVGVLVFVDQQIAQTSPPALARFFVALEELHRQADEVIEIHRLVSAQRALVFGVEACSDHLEFVVSQLVGLRRRDEGVFPRRNLPLQLARHALVDAAGEVGDDLHGVRRVEDRKLRLQPAHRRLLADDAHAECMEGAQREPARRAPTHETGDALLHFVRSLVGEGDCGDVLRTEAALLDQVGDLVRDHACLAAARASQYQRRAIEITDCFALGRIQHVRHDTRIGQSARNKVARLC